MCGIAGFSLNQPSKSAEIVVHKMTDLIRHRGPDSSGHFQTPGGRVHLGFRRLAIRDLHPRSNQPMVSASGRSAIAFNGEIYNTKPLADRWLSDLQLRTESDTEVVLELLERFGAGIVKELNGMFAISLVDLASESVLLTRDRMGMKPLYFHEFEGGVAFGSELQLLKPFGLRVCEQQAAIFLHLGYFPAPDTFYRNTFQVCPGEVVSLRQGRVDARHRFHTFTSEPWATSNALPPEHLSDLLDDAVNIRLVSDVPVGAFLSGGVDSALVASSLAKSTESTPTFTVAFDETRHAEQHHAEASARALGLTHRSIPAAHHDVLKLTLGFFECYQQPFADSSGLVTMLLCEAVKQHVTVALSGDGGDEFFAGYHRYQWLQYIRYLAWCPRPIRQIGSFCLSASRQSRPNRLATWMSARDDVETYAEILKGYQAGEYGNPLPDLESAKDRVDSLIRDVFNKVHADTLTKAACFDAMYYIPDDIQVKVDRASMRYALEVRCPMLDWRFARAGTSLTTTTKLRQGKKTVLKSLLKQRHLSHVAHRPKRGFSVPLAAWLRGPLRDYIEDQLQSRTIKESSWIDSGVVTEVWNSFLQGQRHLSHSIWLLLVLSHFSKDCQADPDFVNVVKEVSRKRAA